MDKEDIKPQGHFDILEVQMVRSFSLLKRIKSIIYLFIYFD
jgi:hypothetical protein